jgi:hypothetical protein
MQQDPQKAFTEKSMLCWCRTKRKQQMVRANLRSQQGGVYAWYACICMLLHHQVSPIQTITINSQLVTEPTIASGLERVHNVKRAMARKETRGESQLDRPNQQVQQGTTATQSNPS